MSSRWRTLTTLVLTLVLIAGLVASGVFTRFTAPAAAPPKGPPPVLATTAKVMQENVPIFMEGVGQVQPIASVVVKARIDGQLDQVNFTEGQDVKAGQVLAHIDSRTYDAQLAQVMAARAKDQATLANAKLDLQRYSQLIKEDATSQQTLDTQRATVNQLEATVKNDDAQIKFAQVQLDYTTIRAPISGRIGARLVDPGNIVHAADTTGLLVINQIDPIAVLFTLPESAFQSINSATQTGAARLAVKAYSRDGTVDLGDGSLVLVNNQIDTSTGTIQLKAHFPNKAHKLWPGQTVTSRLVLGDRDQALTVPSQAVQRSQSNTFIYLVNADQSVKMQPVTLYGIQEGKAVIKSGVAAGDRIVVDGQYKLKPGVHIQEAKNDPSPPVNGATQKSAPDGAAASPAPNLAPGTTAGAATGSPAPDNSSSATAAGSTPSGAGK